MTWSGKMICCRMDRKARMAWSLGKGLHDLHLSDFLVELVGTGDQLKQRK